MNKEEEWIIPKEECLNEEIDKEEAYSFQIKGKKYFLLAILAFIGVLGELPIVAFEFLLNGSNIREWSVFQADLHWIFTSVLWGLVSYKLWEFAGRKYHFHIWKKGKKVSVKNWIIVVILMAACIAISCLSNNGLKIIAEFKGLGINRFIFQYIYYIFETLIFCMIIAFGQKAFDRWFKKPFLPTGGFLLALTWGAMHFLTQDLLTGFVCIVLGAAYGWIYLLLNKDLRKTYPILFLLFIL